MCLFIETLRIEDGKVWHAPLHDRRMNDRAPPKNSGTKMNPFLIHCLGRISRIKAAIPLLSFILFSFIKTPFYLIILANSLEIHPAILLNIHAAGRVIAMQARKVGQ